MYSTQKLLQQESSRHDQNYWCSSGRNNLPNYFPVSSFVFLYAMPIRHSTTRWIPCSSAYWKKISLYLGTCLSTENLPINLLLSNKIQPALGISHTFLLIWRTLLFSPLKSETHTANKGLLDADIP